jgi:hypothetical protein
MEGGGRKRLERGVEEIHVSEHVRSTTLTTESTDDAV